MAKENKEIKKDDLSLIKEKRKLQGEAKLAEKKNQLDQREEFRKFFAKISAKYKMEKSLENILWIHFKNAGFAEKEKFESGLKNFGYKI